MASYIKKASVLMACYNSESFLGEAVDSVLDQSFRDFEFIIVNDGSTDRSRDLLSRHNDSRVKVIDNEVNLGLISSLNIGLSTCEGEYIIRMDADDISEPQRFEKLISYMDNNPDIGACSSYFEFGIGSNNVIKYPLGHEEIFLSFLTSCPFGHAPAILRHSVLDENQLEYDPDFVHSEDSNLWVRMLNLTRFANYPEMLYRVRVHSLSITRKFHDQVNLSFCKSRNIHFTNICSTLGVPVTALPFDSTKEGFGHVLEMEKGMLGMIKRNEETGLYDADLLNKNLSDLWLETVSNIKDLPLTDFLHVVFSPLLKYRSKSFPLRLRLLKKWLKAG